MSVSNPDPGKKDFNPMTENQTKLFAGIIMGYRRDKQGMDTSYEAEIKGKDFICQIVEKRLEAYKLPKFEPSAVLAISVLSKGHPASAVLMMIDILEKYGEKEIPIDVEFIATEVYPWGFYTDKIFGRIWDDRRANKGDGFNYLI